MIGYNRNVDLIRGCMTMLYPLFLDLSEFDCLIVGAGNVGLRKLASLLECSVHSVLLLDVCPPSEELKKYMSRPEVRFCMRSFQENDLEGMSLVFAASGNAETNACIASLCRRRKILCNCVDAPSRGTCIVPATARSGALSAALSTSGASPALAKRWKEELKNWLQPRSAMAAFMGRLRPLVLALNEDSRHNALLFRSIAASGLQQALFEHDAGRCAAILADILPPKLQKHISELLHDLV